MTRKRSGIDNLRQITAISQFNQDNRTNTGKANNGGHAQMRIKVLSVYNESIICIGLII